MAKRGRVVLVSQHGREITAACEKALTETGIESISAHNCWSAEVAQETHDADAAVIDGQLLCGFVSADRPGPLLSHSPKLPVVVFNARELDEAHLSAATAQNALLVDGEDAAEIARCVGSVLDPS